MSAKRVEVIITDLSIAGNERFGTPYRRLTQIWSLDGELIAEVDPFCPYELSKVTGKWEPRMDVPKGLVPE